MIGFASVEIPSTISCKAENLTGESSIVQYGVYFALFVQLSAADILIVQHSSIQLTKDVWLIYQLHLQDAAGTRNEQDPSGIRQCKALTNTVNYKK